MCCSQVPALFNCPDLYIDVESYPSFSNVAINNQIDCNGNFISQHEYSPGGPGDIVVVSMFYQWPLYVTGLGFNISNLSGNQRLLVATRHSRTSPIQRILLMKSISKMGFWARLCRAMLADRRGVAAIEFVLIVPIMLLMFFGTVEFSSRRRRSQGHADGAYALGSDSQVDPVSTPTLAELLYRRHRDHDAVFAVADHRRDLRLLDRSVHGEREGSVE